MDIKIKASAYVITTVITGALIPLLVEPAKATNMFGFFMLVALVSAITGTAFLFLTKSTGKLVKVLHNPKELGLSILIALLTFLPIEFGIAYAEKFVSAALATVLFRTSPLLMLPLLPILLHERLSKYQVAALSLAFVGIAIGVMGGAIGTFAGASVLVSGFVVMLAFVYAVSTVLVKKYMIDMASLLTISAGTLFVLFSLLYLASYSPISLGMVSVASILFLGIGSNFLFFYMYFAGLRILKTTLVTNISSLSPFITFVFASILLGEKILPYYVAIAVLVGVGIVLQRFDAKGGSYLPSKRKSGALFQFAMLDVTGAFAASNSNGELGDLISSGGRVVAAKMVKDHKRHAEALAEDPRFRYVYTDPSRLNAKAVAYANSTLRVGDDEALIIKAGNYSENEEFFNELSRSIESIGEKAH